jgi:membrane-bound lytic murein transglycosylase
MHLLPYLCSLAQDPQLEKSVARHSGYYRSLLGGLGEDIFGAAVQLCLDDIRRASAKKVNQTAQTAKQPLPFTFHLVNPGELPMSCPGGNLEEMKKALRNQLASCKKFPAAKLQETRKFGCRNYTRQEWCLDVNQKLLELAEGSASFAEYLEKSKAEFDWAQSDGWTDGDLRGKTQFTAYHGPPPIEASSVPTKEYTYPIYKRPADLVSQADVGGNVTCGEDEITGTPRHVCQRRPAGSREPYAPYPDRNAIDNQGALKGQGLEIAWVRDPVEVAFLMVEGSGSINVHQPDGSVKNQRLNYDSQNGRALNMLGRIVLCEGGTKEDYGSLSGIKNFLAAHPDRLKQTLAFDQSYVFFKPDDKGPFGADDIPVTARHSFATDRRILPTGSAMLVHTKRPGKKDASGCDDISSMGISQDSGGAINGPHVDWYMGEGQQAQEDADSVNQPGDLFVALPKGGGKEVPGCGERVSRR